MKLHTYAFLAAALACGMANSQTAYTTPVGYITVAVPANSDTTVSPGLERPSLLVAASSSISGNDIGASGLTAGSLASGAGSYVLVTSGPLAGKRYTVASNTTTSITVEGGDTTLEAQGFASGNTYRVVPFWTLDTLFPNGAGVGSTSDALNPTSFVFAASTGVGINKASAKAYIHCSGDIENELPAGWYDNDAVFDGALTEAQQRIDPSRMYSIRSADGLGSQVVITGQVPSSAVQIPVPVDTDYNDVYLGAPYPIDLALQDTGLQSAIQASPDALNPIELIFVYDDLATGINKAAAKSYFYCSGDTENELPAGWYDNDAVFDGPRPAIEKQISAGRSIVIRKAPYLSAGSVNWVAPLPYTL